MGLTVRLSDISCRLTACLRWSMFQPPPANIRGLFTTLEYQLDTRAWHDMLPSDASSCKLVRLEFCKAKSDKLHEFLVLYFSHPTHPTTHAVVIVDRMAKNRAQSSALAVPSVASQDLPEADDRVHVMGRGDDLQEYLKKIYDQYQKLCILEYPPVNSAIAPSAIQLSTLLLVVTNHQRVYNLYQYNCYWFANTIFEACKVLFPGYEEECIKRGDRGRSQFKLPMLATNTLPDICNKYHAEWNDVKQRRRASRGIIPQQELERKLVEEGEERKALEAKQQDLERRLEVERKARETMQQDFERRVQEEAERRVERLQAVRKAPPHLPVN